MPRLSSFGKKTNNGDSMSPGDMKIANRLGLGPSVAPNDNAGRLDPSIGKKRRSQFNQRYYKPSNSHPDYLQGNPDSRRDIEPPPI